jgi:hypothetical protein
MGAAVGRKRWALPPVVLLLLAAAVLGCGAGGPRPSPGAHVVVALRADGSGRVDFWVGGGMRSDRELRDLGGRVAAALFQGKALTPTIVEPGTAFTFARTEVARAYVPGRRPTFEIAGRRVGPTLKTAGYPGYTLLVRLPRVRSAIGSRSHSPGFEYSWKVAAGGPPPAGVIVMHPRLLHWAVEMALLAAAITVVTAAFIVREVRIAVAGCAAGLVAAVAVLVSDAVSGDALGTLGYVSGIPLTLVTRLPFISLPLVVLAIIRLVHLLTKPTAPDA